MSESAFGVLLLNLRGKRGLSIREFAKLAGMDHTYVYRLETGEKYSPSEDSLEKLISALKAGKRETDMLRYLGKLPTKAGLVKYVLDNPTITFEEFKSLASVVHRGPVKSDYPKLIERIRKILDEESSDG